MISKQDKIRGNTFQFRSTTTHVALECLVYRLIFDGRSCVSNHRCSNRESSIRAFFDVRMSSFCLASFLATLLRNDYSFLFSSIILTVSFSFWSFHSKVDPISYHRLPFYTRVCIIDDKHNKFAISRYKSYERRIISYSTNSFNSVLCMCMCMCMLIVFFVRGWYKVVQGDWKFGWLKNI